MKKLINEKRHIDWINDLHDQSIPHAVKWLIDQEAFINRTGGTDVILAVESYGHGSAANAFFTYRRLETDIEYKDRLDLEGKRANAAKVDKEQVEKQERETLAKLLKKYPIDKKEE